MAGGNVEATELNSWAEFEEKVSTLRDGVGGRASPLAHVSSLLFRGQEDAEFPLTTTLERMGCNRMRLSQYNRLMMRIKPAVETFTGTIWPAPEYSDELEKAFHDPELMSLRRFPSVDLYRYMVYLRHHGFPSPLLDWSYSPYVAAFFAFRNACPSSKKRAIYAYCEMPEGSKGGAVGEPTISPIGPYVRSHRRHFRQQSDYTICAAFDNDYGWRFHPHEQVFSNTRPGQDALWKFVLPSMERVPILQSLNDHNLNAFSLFDSEESLLETMWLREHVLKASRQAKVSPSEQSR